MGDQLKMTTIDSNVGSASHAQSRGTSSSLVSATGVWITSSDSKKIGRLFVGVSLLLAVIASVLGALLGFERMSASSMGLINGDAVLQVVSMYQFALVLGVLAPLFVGIALAVVPMQVGSRAVALPRLAQFGFWAWFFGVAMVAVSLVGNGGPGGGTTDLVDLYLLAVGLTAVGIVAACISIVTTVLTSRAPGMTLDLVPAFSWSALVGAAATALSLPVTVGTIIYLYIDQTHAKLLFDGNKGIDKYMNWSFSAPMTFVLVVMAFGVLAEITPVTAGVRQPLRPIVLAGLGLASAGVLGAVTQSFHSLEWTGSASDKIQSAIPYLLFNGVPLLGAIVSVAVVMLSVKNSKIKLSAPFASALFGALMILTGMAGNMILRITPAGLAGTAFEEGITLYVVYGALLSAIGALSYWAPKLWGRTLDPQKLLGLGGIGLLGTVAASLPLFVAGFANQPANVVADFSYDGPQGLWNLLNGVGHVLMIATVVGFVLLLISAIRGGEPAANDPWDAHTLEWSLASPVPTNNFESLSMVNSSEPVLDEKPSSQEVSA